MTVRRSIEELKSLIESDEEIRELERQDREARGRDPVISRKLAKALIRRGGTLDDPSRDDPNWPLSPTKSAMIGYTRPMMEAWEKIPHQIALFPSSFLKDYGFKLAPDLAKKLHQKVPGKLSPLEERAQKKFYFFSDFFYATEALHWKGSMGYPKRTASGGPRKEWPMYEHTSGHMLVELTFGAPVRTADQTSGMNPRDPITKIRVWKSDL